MNQLNLFHKRFDLSYKMTFYEVSTPHVSLETTENLKNNKNK